MCKSAMNVEIRIMLEKLVHKCFSKISRFIMFKPVSHVENAGC